MYQYQYQGDRAVPTHGPPSQRSVTIATPRMGKRKSGWLDRLGLKDPRASAEQMKKLGINSDAAWSTLNPADFKAAMESLRDCGHVPLGDRIKLSRVATSRYRRAQVDQTKGKVDSSDQFNPYYPVVAACAAAVIAATAAAQLPPELKGLKWLKWPSSDSSTVNSIPKSTIATYHPTSESSPLSSSTIATTTLAATAATMWPELQAIPDAWLDSTSRLQRDLGYLDKPTTLRLEQLLEVDTELSMIPTECATCRIAGFDVFEAAIRLGLAASTAQRPDDPAWSAAEATNRLAANIEASCRSLKADQVFGIVAHRATTLEGACDRAMASKGVRHRLGEHAGHLAASLANRKNEILPTEQWIDDVCAVPCRHFGSSSVSLDNWPALLETVLGREPLGAGVLGTAASTGKKFPDELATPLLYFAAAKSDRVAVKVISALSGAEISATVTHGGYKDNLDLPTRLGKALAGLMSPPSIRQQLELLRFIGGSSDSKSP